MYKNTWRALLVIGMAVGSTGCMTATSDESEELGVSRDSISDQVGVLLCSDPGVDPSTPAGNVVVQRTDHGNIGSGNVYCATAGLAELGKEGEMYEVVADQELAKFAGDKGVTCAACLELQALHPPDSATVPPGGPPSADYIIRVSYPTNVVSLGSRGLPPVSSYYFGSSAWEAESHDSSWCHDAEPEWGRLSNGYGYELVQNANGESQWGTNAYQMWDAATYTVRVAAVNPLGNLSYVPWVNVCH